MSAITQREADARTDADSRADAPAKEVRIAPAGGDGFLEFIQRLSGWRLFWALVLVGLLGLFPPLVCLAEGTFFNPQLGHDIAHDAGYWVCFVLQPIAVGWTLSRYFRALPTAVKSLRSEGVLREADDLWRERIKQANQKFRHPLIVLTPWFVGVLAAIVGTLAFAFGKPGRWTTAEDGRLAGFAGVLGTWLLFYMLSAGVCRLVGVYRALRVLFAAPTHVQPLHPDGCGGLAALGRLSNSLNIMTISLGLVTAVSIYSNRQVHELGLFSPLNITLALAYLVGSSVAFFLPLYAAHTEMKEARTEALREINRHFDGLNDKIRASLGTPALGELMAQADNLRKIHDTARSMPVYPFNTLIVSSFATSIALPVVTALLSHLATSYL